MGMMQYKDGSFGPMKTMDQLKDEMDNYFALMQMEMEQHKQRQTVHDKQWKDYSDGIFLKALHFGTEQELEEVKQECSVKERLTTIEDQLRDLDIQKRLNIHIPTQDEIKQFVKKDSVLKIV